MKNVFRILGIIALAALIGFSFVACSDPDDGGGGGKTGGTGTGEVTLTGIAVTTPPNKREYYVNESFSPTGMVVTATYSDGTTKPVTGYTTSGLPTTTIGWVDVTVTYQGKTAITSVLVGNQPFVATPTAGPAGGTLISIGQLISLQTGTDGATIYYTVDGTNPTTSSTRYTSPIAVTSFPFTIKAIGVKDGFTTSPVLTATYNATNITVADISIVAPTLGATPTTEVLNREQERFTAGTVSWLPNESTFQANKVYTAIVTLTAKPGYTFKNIADNQVKVNGESVSVSNKTDNTLTLAHPFPAVDPKGVVTGIEIKSQPTNLSYTHGDELDLSGLVVTLTYASTETEDVAAAYFSDKNITTDPAHDIPLEYTTYNGLGITIKYGQLPALTTDVLTIAKGNASTFIVTIDADAEDLIYNSTEITPAYTVKYPVKSSQRLLDLGRDYTAEYTDNIDAGTATLTITGIGDYEGTKDVTFEISKADPVIEWPTASNLSYGQTLADSEFTVADSVAGIFTWDDDTITPPLGTNEYDVTFTPTDTKNYNIAYGKVSVTVNPIPITTANITITGPATGATPATAVSNVEQERFTSGTVTWDPAHSTFQSSTEYTATVMLTAKTGYTFTGLDHGVTVNGDTVDFNDISISGNGDTLTLSYTFAATSEKAISNIAISTPPTKLTYKHGDLLDLSGLTVTLTYDDTTTEDVDFDDFGDYNITASPSDGTPLERSDQDGEPITISIGDVSVATAALTVNTKPLSDSEVSVNDIAAVTYSGSAHNLSVTVTHTVLSGTTRTLVLGTDYTLSYANNTNAGTATITINGTDDYSGSTTKTFTINPKDIADVDVSPEGGVTTKTYTGSAITQDDVVVYFAGATLGLGTDYTVDYSDNTNAGTATVTLTGKGNFTGSTFREFTIGKATPVITTEPTATDITVGAALFTSVLSGGVASVTGSFAWDPPNEVLAVGSYNRPVTFTPTDTDNYETVSISSVSINVLAIDISSGSAVAEDQVYQDNPNDLIITVTLGGETLAVGTDYTVAYDDDYTDAEANDEISITINGTGKYEGTINTTFKLIVADGDGRRSIINTKGGMPSLLQKYVK